MFTIIPLVILSIHGPSQSLVIAETRCARQAHARGSTGKKFTNSTDWHEAKSELDQRPQAHLRHTAYVHLIKRFVPG